VGTLRKFSPILLLALVGATIAGLILTSNSAWRHVRIQGASSSPAAKALAGDQQLLETAQSLQPLAVTPKELELAGNAQHLADQELDLAFDDALRSAAEQPSKPSASFRALQTRIAQLSADVSTLQNRIKNLTAKEAHAKGSKLASLAGRVELAQAQLALDQDSLADAQQDLARSSGDAYHQIRQLWKQHEASFHAKEAANLSPAPAAPSGASVIARWRYWRFIRAQYAQLIQARQQALEAASKLTREHTALKQTTEGSRLKPEALTNSTIGAPTSVGVGPGVRPPAARQAAPAPHASNPAVLQSDTAAHLAMLRRLSVREKNLADLDRRIMNLHDLTGIYDQWSGIARGRARAALHSLILSVLYILLTVLFLWLAFRLAEHGFSRIRMESRQLLTLRGVVRFSVEALGIATVLLVIFGVPRNLSTILGLAGAGLTVALKDFIVSFIGWFTLMGRRGIRVGDWVEINGVRGEVIEITLFRTVLLETDNWAQPGHPTGRQVTFLNSYAVEGYYFNFTTTGQWLWDEITLTIPSGVDPYPVIEQIERLATRETEASAKTAEAEWKRATHGYSAKSFTSAPAINVRSTDTGVEVTVRYITRAYERYAVGFRLSNAAARIIQQARGAAPPRPLAPVSEAVAHPSGAPEG
jgi:small-conductance mechanosensitive channel